MKVIPVINLWAWNVLTRVETKFDYAQECHKTTISMNLSKEIKLSNGLLMIRGQNFFS